MISSRRDDKAESKRDVAIAKALKEQEREDKEGKKARAAEADLALKIGQSKTAPFKDDDLKSSSSESEDESGEDESDDEESEEERSANY